MMETVRKHGLLLTLVWCTVLCAMLIGLRMAITEQHTYRWLIVPNVILAWIPYGCSSWLARSFERSGQWNWKWTRILAGLVWLFFFPNCFYILTDLAHLAHFYKPGKPVLLYYDVSINVLAAVLGWMLGVLSLFKLHRILILSKGAFVGHSFALLALVLGSVGVYLGRFLRWNSWDLLREPFRIVRDTTHALTQWNSLQFIVVFALVTGTLYFVLYNWKQSSSAA